MIKKILNWLNYHSVSVFTKIHFRKQAKNYCEKNHIKEIDTDYKQEIDRYWKKYIKNRTTVFHRWYSGANGIKDARYIPEDFFYDVVERYFNDMTLEPAYTDKGMFKKLYPDLKQPYTVIVNMNGNFYDEEYNLISESEAADIVSRVERYVIKPTRDSGGGKNVSFIKDTFGDTHRVVKLFMEYKKDFIIQLPLVQHSNLAELHKESINTIRVMSFFEDGEVSIISTIIRMGVGDSCVDNECSGGINCGVNADGSLSSVAYDGSGKTYPVHPQGCEFSKGRIPSYDKIVDVIKTQHKKMPYFGLISWDFTVDETETPVMIELNLSWCGLNFHQLHHGPLFGERTDEILGKIVKE